ncbi:hypothetical protein BSL78_06477 [Apostichopus japonicus]|uniref:Uncharacterized protein n=1 Tax=Stichopus japonicus TaxID=307972 RepID=A0A2G8L8P1_STIJA|nr:hypothetical protein BSL78_06477 [Apostichopus japonicus]
MDPDWAKDTTLTAKCRMLLSGALHGKNTLFLSDNFKDLRRDVISKVRDDEVKRVLEADELILMFGASLLERLGALRRHVISQRMRQLARLLITFKLTNGETSLMELIDASRFDNVVVCVRGICGNAKQQTVAGVNMFTSPSYGLHIGHSLVKCSMLKRGRAIRLKNHAMKEEAVSFLELMEGQDWISKISSPALQSLKERRFNTVDGLPSTSDLQQLRSWTLEKFQRAQKRLIETPDEFQWKQLANSTFVLATTFNKRRSGEVARMSLSSYVKRPKWQELRNEEMKNALSPLELKIADRFDMVQLPGKRGRRVPLLLKPEWVEAMDLLVKLREKCAVHSKFFFGVPGKDSHINSWKV